LVVWGNWFLQMVSILPYTITQKRSKLCWKLGGE